MSTLNDRVMHKFVDGGNIEMKMCIWTYGHTLIVRERNNNITERLDLENITERSRKARLGCFGHVKRRYQEGFGRELR